MVSANLSVFLLGSFEVRLNSKPLGGFEYNKVRALLAYLAVEGSRPQTRSSLSTLLWPDLPEAASRQNLSQALTQLRKILGEKQAELPFLITTTETVQLNPQSIFEVDSEQFSSSIAQAEKHVHRAWHLCTPCAQLLLDAVQRYRGDFLSQFYVSDSEIFEAWALQLRERLRQRMLSALERLMQYYEWRGEFAAAVELAQRQIDLEPLQDRSQRELMRLLALNGQCSAALSQYEAMHKILAEELDLEPEPATTALYQQILMDQALDQLRRWSAPAGQIPAELGEFVGREDDLEKIQTRLAESRLVTISGPPGVGKTRLALKIAQRLRYGFEAGVFFVELAPIQDPALLAVTIAQALGINEKPDEELFDTIIGALKNRHLLLIVDNFEQLTAAASTLGELLKRCPEIKLLVTSRIALHLPGESLYILAPLQEQEAVQLFSKRALAVRQDFVLSEHQNSVLALCHHVDHLPLGIELLAVKTRVFSPQELLRQLAGRLDAASLEDGDAQKQPPGLRQAIAWSFERLREGEKKVFACLGLFAGGCTLEAAQAVAGMTKVILPDLESLVESSLVQAVHTPVGTRFTLLETIRTFALEQLSLFGDFKLVARQRYLTYYSQLAQEASTGLTGLQARFWLERISIEQDNFRQAFGLAMQDEDWSQALTLASGIWRYHWMHGFFREGLERLETALQRAEAVDEGILSQAMRAAGTLAYGLSDYSKARAWLEKAVATGRQHADDRIIQPALTNLGLVLCEQGDFDSAEACLQESLQLARQAENPCTSKFPLGILGHLHFRQGDLDQAKVENEECLYLNRVCEDLEGTADSLRGLAVITLAQGDAAGAQRLVQEALALHQTLQHQLGLGLDYSLMAEIARRHGNYGEALASYQLALRQWVQRENRSHWATLFDGSAALFSELHAAAVSVRLLAFAALLRERSSVKLTAAEQKNLEEIKEKCRTQLGAADYEEAWQAGHSLTMETAVHLILAEQLANPES